MQKCLVFFSIFSSLVAAVDLLSCEDCISPGETCHGNIRPCFLGEDTCGSFLGETTLGPVGFMGALKACTGHRACRAGIRTMTLGPGITLRRKALCCKSESCQGESAKCMYLTNLFETGPPGCIESCIYQGIPPVNTSLNGFSCPACYAQHSHGCEAEKVMACTGSENYCVYIIGMLDLLQNITAVSSRFTARGCSTQSVCEHSKEMSVFSGPFTYTVSRVKECYPAPPSTNSACLHHRSWGGLFSQPTIALMSSYFLFLSSFLRIKPLAWPSFF
ncbi:phospholipase A2 inhibitor and Ly6/PLAUR domain-containing protein-like [Elgaria multicarinata webbii]|uniref:phospholipase A2 inhibitor and Ly6/PLAUR domain-containing protein-like n=1 Tax=Elgaria multicarinata webbii TaxID=159646 RepID=UPI002FCCEC0E